jgi:DNA-binding GntR family transcriptional regulator
MNDSVGKAYTAIRRRILSGEFSAGTLLPAKHLAEEIGVSRTPVRDALRELETEGLIVLTPRQEARVKSVTFEEFRDLCELRTALEVHAAALAAERRLESDVVAMRQSLETMRELAQEFSRTRDKETYRRIAREDIRFHTAVVDAARNKLLKEEAMRLHIIAKVVSAWPGSKTVEGSEFAANDPFDVWKRHHRIFEEIRMQCRDGAKQAMEEHLLEGMQTQLKAMRETEADDFTSFL